MYKSELWGRIMEKKEGEILLEENLENTIDEIVEKNNEEKSIDENKEKDIKEDVIDDIPEQDEKNTIDETDKQVNQNTIDETDEQNKKENKTEQKIKNTKAKNIVEDKNDDSIKIAESSTENNTNQIIDKNTISSKIVEDDITNQIISSKLKGKYTKLLIGISFACIIVLLLIFSTIFALVNLNSEKIISGVSIKGIDVSGLTKQEAIEKINSVITNKLNKEFELYYGEYKTPIVPNQFEANFDIETSINTAYEKGRNKNIFVDNFEIISTNLFNLNIIPSFTYNEEIINNLVSEMQTNLPGRLVEPSYYIDGDNLVITKGIDGIVIDSDLLKLKLISNINDFYNENKNIEIPVINAKAKDIDIDTIHSEVYKEPKDAYYTTNPFCVYPHEIGIDFSISIDEAKTLIQEPKDNYVIELKYTTPNITTNQIGTEAFPNLLSEFSTTYSTRNTNRSTNIRLASSKIDGTVVMPGETFSYNSTVGKRTAAAGFKEAAVYSGGEVTTGIGGGICQVSSTLYNSVLLANLEIVERYNHGFNPGYVPAGRDATVSWGGPDFKFKNTRNYPVRIVANGSGGTIHIEIFGLKEENEYEVEIESYITSYIPYSTIERPDATLPTGETRVVQSGSSGCRSVCYRILKQNGEVVSKDLLSSDTYSPHNKVVAVGT